MKKRFYEMTIEDLVNYCHQEKCESCPLCFPNGDCVLMSVNPTWVPDYINSETMIDVPDSNFSLVKHKRNIEADKQAIKALAKLFYEVFKDEAD